MDRYIIKRVNTSGWICKYQVIRRKYKHEDFDTSIAIFWNEETAGHYVSYMNSLSGKMTHIAREMALKTEKGE